MHQDFPNAYICSRLFWMANSPSSHRRGFGVEGPFWRSPKGLAVFKWQTLGNVAPSTMPTPKKRRVVAPTRATTAQSVDPPWPWIWMPVFLGGPGGFCRSVEERGRGPQQIRSCKVSKTSSLHFARSVLRVDEKNTPCFIFCRGRFAVPTYFGIHIKKFRGS